MKYPKLIIGLIAICLIVMVLVFMSCSKTTGTTSDAAIETAKNKVTTDGVMSLEGRDEVVVEEGENWHVYFPLTNKELLGGEPHVRISKSDGSLVRISYTQ